MVLNDYLERGGQATEHSGPKMTIWDQEPSTLALEGMGPQRTNQIKMPISMEQLPMNIQQFCVHLTSK